MPEKPSCQALLHSLLDDQESPKEPQETVFSRTKFLETVFAQAPDGIVTLDTEHRVLDWNAAAQHIFGYSREEAQGHDLDELINTPESLQEARPLSRQLLRQKPVVATETVRYAKNGTPVPVRVSGAPIIIDGVLHGLVAIYTDITDRKRAEKALVEQKHAAETAHKQWQLTFDTVPDLIALIDTQHRIFRVNRAMAERLGRQPEELIGQACHTLVHNCETPPSFCPHSQLLQTGATATVEITEDNLGGDFAISVSPLRDQEGTLLGSVHIARDITARKRDEERLKKISQEFEQVFNGTQDAMFLVAVEDDNTFRYIRTNKAHQKATGLSLETLRDKTPHELVGQKAGEAIAANYRRCIATAGPLEYEEELDLPGGRKIWATTLTPVFKKGRLVSIVGSSQDITERKENEKHLQYLATTDELTGLYNRRHFMHLMDAEMHSALRYGHPLAFISLDLDNFKTINDSYGHAAGDTVLEHLAAVLRAKKRRPDSLGRLGGEEFGILAPHTELKGAVQFAERIRHQLAASPVAYAQGTLQVTTSLGVTHLTGKNDSLDAVLKRADDALYEAKRSGKNRVGTRSE